MSSTSDAAASATNASKGRAHQGSFASRAKIIAAISSKEAREMAIKDFADIIRADDTRNDDQKGKRLMSFRKQLNQSGVSKEEVALARDAKLTTAMNNHSNDVARTKMNVAREPPEGMSAPQVERAVTRLAAKGDASAKTGKMRQRMIRMLMIAGALRPIEFKQIEIARSAPGDNNPTHDPHTPAAEWVARHVAKVDDPEEARDFVGLVPGDVFARALATARGWVGDKTRTDRYVPREPTESSETKRFAREYDDYTYKDLRAIGANMIAEKLVGSDATPAQKNIAMARALRHRLQVTAADHYGTFGTGARDDESSESESESSSSDRSSSGSESESGSSESESDGDTPAPRAAKISRKKSDRRATPAPAPAPAPDTGFAAIPDGTLEIRVMHDGKWEIIANAASMR